MTAPFAPLSDVLVIDLSRALAGPHAAMLLGDLGARVIKVEAPGTGDDTRGWGPSFVSPAGELSESTRREHDAPPLLNADGPAILGWLP